MASGKIDGAKQTLGNYEPMQNNVDFICPCDGYAWIKCNGGSGWANIYAYTNNMGMQSLANVSGWTGVSVFCKKGMKIRLLKDDASASIGWFPLE